MLRLWKHQVPRELCPRANPSAEEVPDYPIAYDAAKALHAAAMAAGEFGYGAQWAGQGAPLSRTAPAAELVAQLRSEMERALADR